MEIKVHKSRLILLAALFLAALLAAQPLGSAPKRPKNKKERADSLVRIMKAESLEQLQKNGRQFRKAVASTFLHNGTYLISDTALWDTENKIINCWGHVKVIQDETILTSEKLDYFINDNLAQFRGTLVQLQNKKRNTLRTRHLDYNTQDSLAVFRNGGSMRDEKGQIIESNSGTYSSREKVFTFNDDVNMFSDSVFVKTIRLEYDTERELATFPHYIDFWKGGNMLSASEGYYDRRSQMFFFRNRVHGLSEEQEVWSDTLYYYQGIGDVILRGNAQLQDTTRRVTGVADFIHFQDSISQVTMRINAAMALETKNKGQTDTIYLGADTLIYRAIRMCDISDGTIKASETRLSDIMTDAVTEYRRKAAEDAARAREEALNQQSVPGMAGGKAGGGGPAASKKSKDGPKAAPPKDGPTPPPVDTIKAAVNDSVAAPKPQLDSIAAPEPQLDSLARRDSLMSPLLDAIAKVDSLVNDGGKGLDLDTPLDPEFDMDKADSLLNASSVDTLAASDSLQAPDSLSVSDSLAVRDSLAAADSLAAPKDTTKMGFAYAIRNVKIFRRDIQARCDSMVYCDLDSVARFYLDPVIWNEGDRQYTADSVFVLVGTGGPKKASLQSNAFVITQQDSLYYDQIKGAEVMAYFDSLDNSLKRFDALGGSAALFYLRENGVLATVNKVESKMLSALLLDGNIDQVYYFEQPKNNAYPVVQLPKVDQTMKGFKWRPDERPSDPTDITSLQVRPSERRRYLSKPRAEFRQTEIYFPGYMPRIRREIAIRDSLARIPKPKVDTAAAGKALRDSLSRLDSLARADSLAVLDSLALISKLDTLALRDSLSLKDSPVQLDSLGGVPAKRDSTQLNLTPDDDPLAVHTVDPKQKRLEEREARRKLRIAKRDARIAEKEKRWAELDRRDSLKVEAKKQKALEKERARKLRRLQAIQRQEAKDQAKLEKYIEKYKKQYEREQKRAAARKRTQAPSGGGEVPADTGTGEEPPGSDPVLRDDGTLDDRIILGGGSVPGS